MVGCDPDFYRYLFDACCELMETVQPLPQPVIAQVHSMATAGCQLTATCNLTVTSEVGPCTKITSDYKKRWFVQSITTTSSVRPRLLVQSLISKTLQREAEAKDEVVGRADLEGV